MKLKFNYFLNDFTLEISKVNIFYGYSNSYKTFFCKQLANGLAGKDKSFLINGLTILKNENNVIYVGSGDSIEEHLKLSSKSLLKTLYYNKLKEYFDNDEQILEKMNELFVKPNNILKKISEGFSNSLNANINLSLGVDDADEIISNFIKVSFDNEELSSSQSKEMLFKLIYLLNKENENTFIIIDDFDASFDEAKLCEFLNLIEKYDNITFFLFTNKSSSLYYAFGRYSIFNIRNEHIYNLSNVEFLLKKSMDIGDESHSFEEYMINYGYFKQSGLLDDSLDIIRYNSINNFGRMLTNKEYVISSAFEFNKVCIVPMSIYEKNFLEEIDSLIKS